MELMQMFPRNRAVLSGAGKARASSLEPYALELHSVNPCHLSSASGSCPVHRALHHLLDLRIVNDPRIFGPYVIAFSALF